MIVGSVHNGWCGFAGLVQLLCNAGLFFLMLLQLLHGELKTAPVDVQIPAGRSQIGVASALMRGIGDPRIQAALHCWHCLDPTKNTGQRSVRINALLRGAVNGHSWLSQSVTASNCLAASSAAARTALRRFSRPARTASGNRGSSIPSGVVQRTIVRKLPNTMVIDRTVTRITRTDPSVPPSIRPRRCKGFDDADATEPTCYRRAAARARPSDQFTP